jgi:hypothetical protein
VDYQEPRVSPLDILRRADERELDIIAFTDHNSVRGYADLWREIEDLELLEYLKRLQPAEAERLAEYRRLLDKILVLPGFEFTATFGFHILAIFPPTTTIRRIEHLLLLLGVAEEKFGSGEVGATSDVLRAYEVLADNGALVIGAHVNSTHGVAMQGLRFGGQTKIAYTQDPNLHALEVTDLAVGVHRRSTARFFNGTKPEYPRRMHCIQGSDAHRLARDPDRDTQLGIGDRATEVLLPEVSFEALKVLFTSDDFESTRPWTPAPEDPVKAARLNGNTDTQSFHESLTTKRTGTAHVLRDVVAFANGVGGTIFVGASAAEKRPIHGVEDADPAAVSLRGEIATLIAPAVAVAVEPVVSDGKTVLVVIVAEGPEKPHALAPGSILVRRGAETEPATRDEIVAMVTAGAPVERAPDSARSVNGAETAATAIPQAPVFASAEIGGEPAPNGSLLPVEEENEEPDPVAPGTGIEVVAAYEQDGVTYYTLRDLRDHKLVHNVTRDTETRIWRSAIVQHEEQAIAEDTISWEGDYGLVRAYKTRSSERRYHLAYRGDGDLRVFWGVSAAGMTGPWAMFVHQGAGR